MRHSWALHAMTRLQALEHNDLQCMLLWPFNKNELLIRGVLVIWLEQYTEVLYCTIVVLVI